MPRGVFGRIPLPPCIHRVRDLGGLGTVLPFFDGFLHGTFPHGALLHDVAVGQSAPFDAHGHGALRFVGDSDAGAVGAVGRDGVPADPFEGFGGAGPVRCGGVLAVQGGVVFVVGHAGGVVEAVVRGGAVGGWEGAEGGRVRVAVDGVGGHAADVEGGLPVAGAVGDDGAVGAGAEAGGGWW